MTPARDPLAPTLAAIVPGAGALAALVWAALLPVGCAAPEPEAAPLPAEVGSAPDGPPAYAAYSRERARQLKGELREILDTTLPAIRAERDELQVGIAALEPPIVLASRERRLRAWHQDEITAYRDEVTRQYELAQVRIEALIGSARSQAESLAADMAPPRAPLDAGASGDVLLDRELDNFGEAMNDAVNLNELDAQRQLDLLGRTELVETYTSFTDEGADLAIGGRLMLFVGGPEMSDRAEVRVVLRPIPAGDGADRRVFQAVRYRIMRGTTLVQDLGWRPMPVVDGWGLPEVHDEGYRLWSGLSPGLRRDAAGFEQLKDMRILADLQTAVVAGDEAAPEVLGGVDWRLEFRVTFRGDVAWQPSAEASPTWNAECAEVQGLLEAAAAGEGEGVEESGGEVSSAADS